jgi:hypothetical protein
MYLVLFNEVPNIDYLFKKAEGTKLINSENPFYKQRFLNDVSDLPKDEDLIKINNLYIRNFISKFKQEIIKKPNSFFYKAFHKQLKQYLSATEAFKQKKDSKRKLKKLNFELFYAKKCREPLENFDNLLYPDDLYKVEKTSLNKILNIIIFCDQKKLSAESKLEISNLYNLQSENEIYFKENFKDILDDRFKLLKYLKLTSMTYDLVVKHYYFPKNISFEENNAYLGFYLQKFLERQFNQIELQYLNQNINEIKDSLFEKDVLKLLELQLDISESKYVFEEKFETYLSDELLSIRNEAFSDENDLDEFGGKHKKRKFEDNNSNNKTHLTTLNINNNNNRTRRPNTNLNNNINETTNNNYNQTNKNGFNNANITYNPTCNSNNPKDLNNKSKEVKKYLDLNGKLLAEENIEDLLSFKEKCLRIFSVWNTLFIILFRKNFKYVKFLENLSFSNQLINQFYENTSLQNVHTNDICFKSPYLYLFSRLFFLEQPLFKEDEKANNNSYDDDKISQNLKKNELIFVFKKIDKNIKKLNEVRLLGKLEENELITPNGIFYADLNEYLINIPDETFEKNIKELGQKSLNCYRTLNKFNNFYPGIFGKIWSILDESTKKTLFFGLNESNYEALVNNNFINFSKTAFYEEIIKKVFERESILDQENKIVGAFEKDYFYNNNKNNNVFKYKDLKIVSFFRSEQRSHIFNYLKFPTEKFDECKKAILALPMKGITLDDIERYKNFESLFKFINESKFGLKYIYDFYNFIFDKLFKGIKTKLREVIIENEKLLISVVNNNREFFEVAKNRIKFIKFFKYILTMKKYETIKSN